MSTDDKKATPVAIDSNTALLTYQGDWWLVDAAGLSGALSDEDLTKAVRQLPALKEKCKLFGEHCACLANRIAASGHAWCVEICLKTWRQQQRLRLHSHFLQRRMMVGCDANTDLSSCSRV